MIPLNKMLTRKSLHSDLITLANSNCKQTDILQNNEFEVPKNRLKKKGRNIWTPTTRLINTIKKHTNETELLKKLLLKLYKKIAKRYIDAVEPDLNYIL